MAGTSRILHITLWLACTITAIAPWNLTPPQAATAQSPASDLCLGADPNDSEQQILASIIMNCTEALLRDLRPDARIEILINRGVAFRNLGDLRHSLEDLSEAVRLGDANANAIRMRAWTLRLMKRQVEAEQLYTRALALEPEWQGYLSRCVVRLDLQKLEEALRDCEQALKLQRSADSVFFTAFALFQMGRLEQALPLAAESNAMDESLPQFPILLADIQLGLNMDSEAVTTLQAALDRFPGNGQLKSKLEKALLR